jgi:hypothetical protein
LKTDPELLCSCCSHQSFFTRENLQAPKTQQGSRPEQKKLATATTTTTKQNNPEKAQNVLVFLFHNHLHHNL